VFWFQLVIVAVVLFAVSAVAAGRGGSIGEAYPDRPDLRLPADRQVEPADVAGVRFSVGLRGYRMHEVDQVLARLAAELAGRDARIDELVAAQGPLRGPED
jgi:DivIVA domain-containing protein